MKINLLILLTVCCLISTSACKKLKIYDLDVAPLLPEISSEGRNTFGFMFGKEVWVKYFSLYPTLSANYGSPFGNTARLYIACDRKSTQTDGADDFTLEYFNTNITPGTYP